MEESKNLLTEICAGFRRTDIIIDALDECPESTKGILLEVLELLARSTPNLIKIFVSSRDNRFMRKRLGKFPKVAIREQDTSGDINHCIGLMVIDHIARRELLDGSVTTELKNDIIQVLQKQSKGLYVLISFSPNMKILKCTSFHWPQLQMSALCREVTEVGVRVALTRTPSEVENIYSGLLTEIEQQSTGAAAPVKEILTWNLHAYQPLTGNELLEALSVDPETGQYSATGLTVTGIVQMCKGLVEFDHTMNRFRFLHLSVEKFLWSRFPPEAAHEGLAKICLTLLTYHHTASCHDHLAPSLTLDYARANWAKHVWSSGIAGGDLVRFCHRFFEQSIAFEEWHSNRPSNSPYHDAPDLPALIAPHLGLWNIFEYDIIAGIDVNCCDSNRVTALHVAVRNVDLDGLSWLLLQSGVDVNRMDKDLRSPLSLAAGSGLVDIVNRLLETEGIDLHSIDNTGRTAMDWAVEQGHDNVVEMLKVGISKCPVS